MDGKPSDSSAKTGYPDFSFNDPVDFEVRLDNCILRAQELLKEALQVLHEPRIPALLMSDACCIDLEQSRANTDTVVTDVTASGILVSSNRTKKRAVDLLRVQVGNSVLLLSSKADR